MTGSNRRPPRCKRGALPAELIALNSYFQVRGLTYSSLAHCARGFLSEFSGKMMKVRRVELSPLSLFQHKVQNRKNKQI
jgi:hypothetical protein